MSSSNMMRIRMAHPADERRDRRVNPSAVAWISDATHGDELMTDIALTSGERLRVRGSVAEIEHEWATCARGWR